MCIVSTGIVHACNLFLTSACSFSINLCYGPKLAPNCALHFNPRFNQGCIVRNAMQGGSWGAEERGGGMPLIKGQLFEIIIMATPSSYQVCVICGLSCQNSCPLMLFHKMMDFMIWL